MTEITERERERERERDQAITIQARKILLFQMTKHEKRNQGIQTLMCQWRVMIGQRYNHIVISIKQN